MKRLTLIAIFCILGILVLAAAVTPVRCWMKSWVVPLARKAVGIMYYEAEIHNPEGDLLPDSIDDRVKDHIRSAVQ